ncbi:MAG: GAF domain-containing protein, partial [Waterburya sp.]
MEQEKNDQGNGNGNTKPSEQKTKIQENTVKLFSEISNQIANELGQENILNTTVLELRHLLKCDRVLVYSLDQDSYGVIIAESVAAGLTRALGRTIDDPCFAARYIEKYTQGRVRAWNNVYCEDATPCYLEQLEALGVKAKVVAPIIRENQLFGLLIAHQCSDTRNWQEQEINWITEIATQVGLMLEYNGIIAETAQEEEKLLTESEDKWSQHFTEAIQYIRQSLNPEAILKASVKEVRRVLNCDRVVIYSLNSDNHGLIVAESIATGWKKIQGKVIKDPCFKAKYLERYRNGRVRAWSNIYESGLTQCYIEELEEIEVKANLVTPIINEGQLFGLLVAHQCSGFRNWQQPEIRWVAQIATQVGFALDNAKLLADAKQLQQQLANEAQLTKYFTDATCYIRESLHQEDILEVSVEEVRRVLNCDRVVIYSLNSDNHGMIVAESVTPGWTRAQGRVIKDPCFEAKYLEQYR